MARNKLENLVFRYQMHSNNIANFRQAGHYVVTCRLRRKAMSRSKLTKRVVSAVGPAPEGVVVWDDQLPGFGLRVSPAGTKSFFVRYRPKGAPASKRYQTLGRYGVVTVEQAREHARRVLGAVANGEDPAGVNREERNAPILAMAAKDFLSEHVAKKRKRATHASYTHTLENHVLPKLGRRKLIEVTKSDVAKLHSSLSSIPYMANRAITVLSSLYSWAASCGLSPEGFNPARRIEKFRESRRERFLDWDEFARLGAALREAETIGIAYEVDGSKQKAKHAAKPENRRVVVAPEAVAAIRLLMLTGCRLREILNLRWGDVDFQRRILLLPDSKTGRKTVLLGQAAVEILRNLPRVGECVFPGTNFAKPRSDLKRPWMLIRRRAGLNDLRIHDLRHSYASVAAGAGLGLPIIGKLLGHTQAATTQRYAHLADEPMRVASNAVAEKIAEVMDGQSAEA